MLWLRRLLCPSRHVSYDFWVVSFGVSVGGRVKKEGRCHPAVAYDDPRLEIFMLCTRGVDPSLSCAMALVRW